jgi:hypothetical protein
VVLPVITMNSWNDPVMQRAAELCCLIGDHRFTSLFGLHACSNGNEDFLTRESSICIVECIIASKQEQGPPPYMTLEECCFQIHKRAKRLPNMAKAKSIGQISLQHFRSKKQSDVMFLANGGKLLNSTGHNVDKHYKAIHRYIQKKEAEAAKTVVIDDDTGLLWLPPTTASPASSNARSSMSSLTTPFFESASPLNLTAPSTATPSVGTTAMASVSTNASRPPQGSLRTEFHKRTTLPERRRTAGQAQDTRKEEIMWKDVHRAAYKAATSLYTSFAERGFPVKAFQDATQVAAALNDMLGMDVISGNELKAAHKKKNAGQSPPRLGPRQGSPKKNFFTSVSWSSPLRQWTRETALRFV